MNEDLGWEFVDAGEVASLHRAAMDLEGNQAPQQPKPGCVEGSVGNAITAAMYAAEDGGADLLLAAAYLLVYLAKNHCFVDGNKRVAWSALVRALDMNSFRVVAQEEDAARLVNEVAQGTVGVPEVLSWLAVPGRISASPEA